MSDQLVGGHLNFLLDDDEGLHCFALILVGDADHCSLFYRRMSVKYVFDFVRIDVEAADQNQVLLALNDVEVSILIHAGDVAGVQPSLALNPGCLFRFVPIAFHYLRSAYAQLTLLALGYFYLAGAKIDDLEVSSSNRQPDAARFALCQRWRGSA